MWITLKFTKIEIILEKRIIVICYNRKSVIHSNVT